MALTDLDQSMDLSNAESLTQLDQSGSGLSANTLDEATLDNSSISTNVNDNVTNNLLVNSINQTTEQTTVRPKNVSAGNPMLRQISGQPHFKDANDFFAQTERQLHQNPTYQTGYATPKWTPEKTVEKYDDQDYGYIYGIDNDDFYGKRESWYETVGKAVPRLAMGVVDKVGMGVGFVAGLVNPWNWGEAIYNTATDQPGGNLIDIASDNAMYKTFEALDEYTKNEWLPTFQEAADRKKGFWARAGSDLDFWTDDFVDGVSFLAAAWIPGAILGEIGVGAAMASRLGRVAQGLGVAGEVGVAGIEEASALTRWFAESGKAARQLNAFNSWAIATSSEAMFEASEVKNSILNSPDYDINGDAIINPKTGNRFTPDEKKEMAAQGALNTFLMNAAILGVSNVFEYKYLMKMMGKATPTAAEGLIQGGLNLGEEATVKAATPFWKTFAKETALGTAREGFYEENMQLAVQRYNTKYGIEGKIGGIFDADTWTGMLKQAKKQTVDALYGNDNEAAISIGIGGLIGSIFGTGTSRYQQNKEQKHAQAVMSALNSSQNSFFKFGDVFRYETVDATDKEGNPIKTKQIVLDDKGNPVYDYDKIYSIAAQMKVNADMFDDSFKEPAKFKQEFLRAMGWADLVNAHVNAGLGNTLMAKLDKLETADAASLAKLGFMKDENFPAQLQKYRSIASEIIAQNKALTDNVIFNNTSFFDKKNEVDNSRRAHLSEIVSRQVVYKHMANELATNLETLKSNLLSDDQTHLSDGLVDQLNTSLHRIKSQEDLIKQLKKDGSDKILPMEVYEKVLQNLKDAHAELVKDNETSLKDIALNQDGTYRYKKVGRNDSSVKDQIDGQANYVAELKNSILNDNQIFTFFADRSKGRENYTKFFNAIVAVKTKQAEEKIAREKEQKAADEAKAQTRKETEHTVHREINGTFTIVDPNGVVVEEGIITINEANLKAAELTAKLVSIKEAELKAKEEEERRRRQQSSQQNNQVKTLFEKKQELQDKKDRLEELDTKGYESSIKRIQELKDQGKTSDEALQIAYNEWLNTPDGKEYTKLEGEIEALKKEIEDEEAGNQAPTLQEYLQKIYDDLSTQPDFKWTYDKWVSTGAANQFIKDYNREYSKNEKIVSIAGTSSTLTTDEEAIASLDLKDVDATTVEAALRQIRKIYQNIAGDAALLQQLTDKINEVKNDFYKSYLVQALINKAVSSSYIPLSTVGINTKIEEHKTFDRINMPLEEFMLGFTLIGDPNIIQILSNSTGDITDRVNAVATLEYIKKAQAQLAAANIPNRTIITNETPKDIAKLNQGISIIAKSHKANNFNLQLFLKGQTAGNVYVGGIGNYAIVHPDNTTEKIEWREDQREFVKDNMLIDGKRMTDQQYDTLQEMYGKMQAFEENVMEVLDEYLKMSPNENSMDVTGFFKDAFTLSGKFTARTGEPLEEVIKRAGPDRLFTVQIADENDIVTQKNLPLFGFREGTVWRYEFPLNPGERVVTINENNEIEPVLDFKEYLENEHGLAVQMTDAFPTGRAWISKAENEARGYKPYILSLTRIEKPATFKAFATAFKNLKKAIEDGIADDKNIFKYEGKTYNTINDLMMAFNIDHYGFYQYKGFVANLSYNPKAKVGGKTVGKFLFEFRPQDKQARLALTSDQKRALNMYISDEAMLSLTDTMSDDEVLAASKAWVDGLVSDFDKLTSKLAKSKDARLQKMVDQNEKDNRLDSHLLFEYDLKNNVQSFKLKLNNKAVEQKGDSVSLFPFLIYEGKNINPDTANTDENNLRLSFNDGAATITQQRPVAPAGSLTEIEKLEKERDEKLEKNANRYKDELAKLKETAAEELKRNGVVQKVTSNRIDSYEGLIASEKFRIEDEYKAKIAALEQTSSTTSTSGISPYGVIAADYLFTGGPEVILSTDYFIQALSGAFINAGGLIEQIRQKYISQVGDLGNLKDAIGTENYAKMIAEIRSAIESTYNNQEVNDIFNVVLNNATGFPSRLGNEVSAKLEKLNEELAGLQQPVVSDLEAEKQKITPAEFNEVVRLAKFYLENPNEPGVVGNARSKYPNLYKAVFDLEQERNQEILIANFQKSAVVKLEALAKKYNIPFSIELYELGSPEGYDKIDALIEAVAKKINDEYDLKIQQLIEGDTTSRTIVDDIDPDDNNAPFMLEETEENYEKYTEASFNQEIEWLRKALAGTGIRLEDLGTIINNLVAKKNVLGYYKDKAIYVSEALSKRGTIYHEAFHALFRDVFTSEQRAFFLNKMQSKVGYITNSRVETFRNERGYFNKTDEEIRDLIYEEYLSEGFREFKLKQKQPKEGWFKKFIALFDRIVNFFKSKKTDIEGLYEDFDAGRYSGTNNQASTISKEGAYSIAYGRPKLFVKEGATNFSRDNTQVLNLNLQNELVYKLTNIISTQSQGTFTEKFNNAVQQLKKDYNIDNLIKNSADPATFENAIRSRYGEMFNDALYILGDSVPYALSDELQGASDAMKYRTVEGSNANSLDIIKKEVQNKINSLGLSRGFDVDNLEIPESDEDRIEREKGGEFDTIHMNPLEGLSREFRSLFSTIPYKYEDPQLGVTINKMADGNMLFNAMIKIAANTPLDQILPSLTKAVNMMKEDNDRTSAQLEAFVEFIQKQFGISDLSDPTARPSKNIYLYKQFIDTFFITELPSKQVKLNTTDQGSTAEIFDASINADMAQKKDAIGYFYEQAYRRLDTPEAKEEFNKKFRALQDYIKNSLFVNLKDSSIVNARTQQLNKVVDKMKTMLDDINIVLPKNLIRQSFLAIYNVENGLDFSAQSKQNRMDMEADQRLMKEGAYLQSDFFFSLSNIKDEENFGKIFANTKESYVDLGRDFTQIERLNGILRKAMKYAIKYDINSAIPVFQNAENKKIWRYSRYTPPVLLTQMVREEGIQAITDLYPILREWYGDNPLFDGSPENELFLQNLYMSSFGGFRQEIDDDSKAGSTFGSIDTKALLISGIINFMNRETVTKKMKGIKDDVTITTYERSRTQEEATTSNFLMTAKYQKLINKDGSVSDTMIDNLTQMIQQEYNRIGREWESRENSTVVRYNGYNNNVHPETNQPIQGDSYTKLDGKTVQLRAYQFKNFEHFFDQQKTTEDNQKIRQSVKDVLRDAAKNGLSFAQALEQEIPDGDNVKLGEFLKDQLKNYMNETFDVYLEALNNNEILSKEEGKTISKLIPGTIKEDFKPAKPIQDYGYDTMEDMLKDQHLNTFLNKLLVNQIFDGDIATGIKSAVEYYKRNKAGVISGNSMKFGFFRTAVVQNIQADVNAKDLTDFAKDITDDTENENKVDIADGQSYHSMNHRIRMMDAWGRLDPEVRELLNAAKYRKLTKKEIEILDNKKVVLNTIKTATGGVFEYYKLSEHLISRTEVSHLVLQTGQEIEDAYDALDDLYNQIETLEDSIVANPYGEDVGSLEDEIEKLYKEVHKYWEPKRSRVKLHNLLNSMELSGIDQLFDTNASKKTTIAPIKLNENDITDLKPSKSFTSGLFKFMQVETSGVKKKITLPTQARQLLTTYLGKLDTKAYNNKTIAQLANDYATTLGKITNSNIKALDARLLNKDGSVNITELYEMMYEGLLQQGADANTLKFFEIKDGKPVHNPNMPVIKKLFTYYYFAMFNDSVFSESVSGRSDILVSSFGHDVLYDTQTGEIITSKMQEQDPQMYKSERYETRPLGVDVEVINGKKVYTIEVIIPEPLAKNASERELYLEKLNKFFSTRIPTEDKRSMIVCKVVDYMEASYRNSIVVPQLVHILAGSDLDVDKLYSHTFAHYINFNGEANVYGDYSGYATPSQGRFIEYMHYMMNENPAIRDSITAEIKSVEAKPIFTSDFIKLKDELGLSDMEYTAEELKEKRKDLAVLVDALIKEKKELEQRQNALFHLHISNNERKGSEGERKWQESKREYKAVKELVTQKLEELEAIEVEQELLDNTIRLAATVNVLKNMDMPTTQAGLTSYMKENGNPVVTVLQNESLQQKMDILSNEDVFNDFYIKERSSVEPFREIANAIGASVEDVVKANSIHSIMGDIVANQLNSSNKDGIGISASFNKFLAFAEKTGLSLQFSLFGTSTIQGLEQHNDFLNSDGIRNIGAQLGMFADAAKDPIPSVLNLNPETAGTSNLLVGMSGNIQLGLLMNKIPFIEKITKEVAISKSAAQTNESRFDFKNTATLLKSDIIKPALEVLEDEKRLGEIFEKDKEGNIIYGKMLPMYIQTGEPNSDLANMQPEDITLADVGFSVKYEDGTNVLEDVAKIYLAEVYRSAANVNSDIIKLGRILNLIKDQKPEFNTLDQLLADHAYFMSGDSVFGDSIVKILDASAEYKPLIKAAQKMSDYSKQLLIERTPLFKSINNILQTSFSNARDPKSKQNISDQITKLIIIQKTKIDLQKRLNGLQGKEDANSVKERTLIEDTLRYFTSDYWVNNNTFVDDLDYLYATNPGNPFVEFLKVNIRKNIDYLEGSTRMKLDKDIAENINNGYEALQKSSDPRTMRLSRQLFYYTLLKDGLGFSNNSFLSYLNPDLKGFKDVSDHLDNFQELLATQQIFIDEQNKNIQNILNSGLDGSVKDEKIKEIVAKVYANYTALFDKFFETDTPGKIDWINLIVKKIFSNAVNQKYVRQFFGGDIEDQASKNLANDLIAKGVFSDVTKKVSGKKFDFTLDAKSSFTVDFSSLLEQPYDQQMDVVFGNIFDPRINMKMEFVGMTFPMLIKNSKGRLFKLMTIDEKSISEDIAFQSITGLYKGTNGVKAEYREIEIEGTNNILNFGFTPGDGVALYKRSQERFDDDNDLLAMGIDPSEISDNKSKKSINKQLGETQLPEKMAKEAEERRRAKETQLESEGKFTDQLPEKMRLEAEARKKAKEAKQAGQEQGSQFTEELPEKMRLEAEARKKAKEQKGLQPVTSSEVLLPDTTSQRSIDYTPKGKTTQTYTIQGSKIFNKAGDEVFAEDSVDRNKIFANLAVKEGRAKVVEYEGVKYVVNNRDQIISGATGRIMQWDERNKNRIAILALANNTPSLTAPAGSSMADPNAITDADIAAIYRDKVDFFKSQNIPGPSLEQFSAQAKKLADNLKKANMSKEDILEALKCL